jgi:hypothetical protein
MLKHPHIQMLHRKKAKREFAHDNHLLRAAFTQALAGDPQLRYDRWLDSKGIDITTGKMTEAGVTFFKSLLDHDRLHKKNPDAKSYASST